MDDLSLFLDDVNLIILTLSKFDKIDPNTIILTGLLA